jgi:uncharacterized protein involved in exopolysaccharide biosynthesis
MKKLLFGLVYLYPKAWRARYEVEFRELLETADPRWNDIMDIAKEGLLMQFKTGLLIKPLAFGLAAALIAALVLRVGRSTYESQAVISVKAPEFRTGATPTAAVQSITERVLSSKNLVQVMETFHLYEKDRADGQIYEAVEKMRKSIRLSSLLEEPALGFITISFQSSDPMISQRVTQDLVSRFIDENVRRYRGEAEAAVRAVEPPGTQIQVPATLELISPASQGRRTAGPKSAMVIGLALAEGSQLGLIFALLRRRSGHRPLPQANQPLT